MIGQEKHRKRKGSNMTDNQPDKTIDGMSNRDVRALCHLLLLKRDVDGLNGRPWHGGKHLEIEESIIESENDVCGNPWGAGTAHTEKRQVSVVWRKDLRRHT